MQMDGQTDMTDLIVAFFNFVIVPKRKSWEWEFELHKKILLQYLQIALTAVMSVFTAQRNLQMIVVVGSPDSHYLFTRLQCHVAEDGYFQGFLLSVCMLISQIALHRFVYLKNLNVFPFSVQWCSQEELQQC